MKSLPLESILATTETQIRAELRPDLITEYAELYRSRNGLPPIDVFTIRPGGPYVLSDGFHRLAAAKEAKLPKIEVEIHTGDKKTAIKFALKVNSCHGLRLSNADKRHAVEMALKEFANLSNPQIAEMCGVDQSFVFKVRDGQPLTVKGSTSASASESEPVSENGTPETRIGADGKKRPAKVKKPDDVPQETKPEIRLDKVGRPIPGNILELWNRAYEVGTRLRSAVSAVKCELEQSIGKDIAFAELSNPVTSDAAALHFSLSHILPYAVCPTCNGKLPDKCTTCRHRGFVSKAYWEGPCVGNNLRAMIGKQAKSYATA